MSDMTAYINDSNLTFSNLSRVSEITGFPLSGDYSVSM